MHIEKIKPFLENISYEGIKINQLITKLLIII